MGKHKGFTESDLEIKGFVKNKQGFYAKPSYPIKPEAETRYAKKAKIIKKEVPESNYRGKRKSKYGVSKAEDRTHEGKVYMSKLEMNYKKHLDTLKLAGEVLEVEEQIPYELKVGGVKVCKYILDFRVKFSTGETKWIDVKGMPTAVYRLKKKLWEAIHVTMKITEIRKGDF